MIKKLIGRYKNFIIYCIIGVTGATLDFILFYFLSVKLGMYYQYANIISVSAGITNNFILNVFFNFKINDKLLKRFVSFYSVGMLGVLISALALYIFIDIFDIEILLAKFLTIFIITIVQYALNKTISFKKS